MPRARDAATYRAGTDLPYAAYLGGDGLSVRSDLGGLNLSDVPKVFVETGNMRRATRRTAAGKRELPGAHRAIDRRWARAVPFALLLSYFERGMKLIAPDVSSTAHRTSEIESISFRRA